MQTPHDTRLRRLQIVIGSGQTDDARLLNPPGRFWRVKAALMSLLVVAGIIGFAIAAIVVGSLVALLLLGAVSIAFLVALIRGAFRRWG
jgi:hypothetical protein